MEGLGPFIPRSLWGRGRTCVYRVRQGVDLWVGVRQRLCHCGITIMDRDRMWYNGGKLD